MKRKSELRSSVAFAGIVTAESFLRYLFRTLKYAGRGIRPLVAYSLDEPIFDGSVIRIDVIDQSGTRGSHGKQIAENAQI
jgi:hypothetical protein